VLKSNHISKEKGGQKKCSRAKGSEKQNSGVGLQKLRFKPRWVERKKKKNCLGGDNSRKSTRGSRIYPVTDPTGAKKKGGLPESKVKGFREPKEQIGVFSV